MDLSVNLQTVIDVEIDSQSVNLQSVNLDGAKRTVHRWPYNVGRFIDSPTVVGAISRLRDG